MELDQEKACKPLALGGLCRSGIWPMLWPITLARCLMCAMVKAVQRLLYAMRELRLDPAGSPKKCAHCGR